MILTDFSRFELGGIWWWGLTKSLYFFIFNLGKSFISADNSLEYYRNWCRSILVVEWDEDNRPMPTYLTTSTFYLNLNIKGTVRVILSDPPCKDGNPRFTTVPWNLNLIKNVEDIVVFLTLKVFLFLSFSIASYIQGMRRETVNKNRQLKNQPHWYKIHQPKLSHKHQDGINYPSWNRAQKR